MALAILQFQDTDRDKSRFRVSLGATNRFYSYAIAGETYQRNGLTFLQDPIYTSPILGPLPESSLGRVVLEVPLSQFDRDHSLIQLTTFRTRDRAGPAYSSIARVANARVANARVANVQIANAPIKNDSVTNYPIDPPMTWRGAQAMNETASIEMLPFQYQEVQTTSDAMVLLGLRNAVKTVAGSVVSAVSQAAPAVIGAIAGNIPGNTPDNIPDNVPAGSGVTGILQALLPQLSGVIGGILPQLINAGTEGGQSIDPAQITTLLTTLLQQVGNTTPTGQPTGLGTGRSLGSSPGSPNTRGSLVSPAAPAATIARTAAPAPIMNRAPVANRRQVVRAQSMALSVQNYYGDRAATAFIAEDEYDDVHHDYVDSLSTGYSAGYSAEYSADDSADYAAAYSADYSESMFLPVIGGLLSSLIPSLLPAIPSLVSSVGPNLAALLSSLLGPRPQTARQMSLMLGLDEEEAIDQGVMMALGLAIASAPTPNLVFQRVDSVKLAFSDTHSVMMNGKSRFLYRCDRDVSFPLTLETPQPIRKAKLQLLVKDPKTLKVLIEHNVSLETLTTGLLERVTTLSKQQLKVLIPNQEYLVCAHLVWQGRSKKTGQVKQLGTSTLQLIMPVGEYVFDRVEGMGEAIALNDVNRHRPYWHKVWQGDFTDELRRMSFECKYYYTLEPNRTENARMETLTQVIENNMAGRKSRLKAGLIMSPYGLNDLFSQLTKRPPLSEAELTALMSLEFQQRFSQAARTEVKFSGRPRQTVALWVYPEIKLQRIALQRVEQTNHNGQVLSFQEHLIDFPIPAIAHFIGVSTS